MAGLPILSSPLFWLAVAVAVALLLTLLLFGTDARLRRGLRRLARKSGDIRFRAEALRRAPGRVRSAAARALALLAAGAYYDAARILDRAAQETTGPAQAELLNLAGISHYLAGRLEPAVEHYRRAAALAEPADARQTRAAALANLAMLRLFQGEPGLALEAQEQALAIDRETGNRVETAVGLGRLGLAWQARGETARALDLHLEALDLNRAAGNLRGIACDLGRIGLAYQVLGEHDKALEYYRDGYAAARRAGDRLATAEMMSNTGLLLLDKGDEPKALVSLLGALMVFGRMQETARAVNTIAGLRLVRDRLGPDEFAAGCRSFGLGSREMARLAGLLDRFSAGKEAGG